MRSVPRLQIILIFCLLLLPFGILPLPAETHLEVISRNISTDDSLFPFHVEPTMTILDDGTIFAGWKEAFSADGGGAGVSYSYSTNGGADWSDPQLIPTSFVGEMNEFGRTSYQSDPWMQSYGNTLYFAYLEFFGNDSQITISRTSDLGNNWNLVNATENIGFADKETFTIDEEGRIYMTYDDVTEDGNTVKLSRSFDGGETYFENVTISDAFNQSYVGPYITHGDSGELFAAWTILGEDNPTNGDIFFDSSTDYGNTWMTERDINPGYNASTFTYNVGTQRPEKVSLPVMEYTTDDRIYLAWDDVSTNPSGYNWDVYLRYSDDKGASWSDRIRVNPTTEYDQWMPELALDSQNNLHIIYYGETSSTRYELKYRVWNSTEGQFTSDLDISSNPISTDYTRPGEYNTMIIDETDKVHMVWTNSDGSGLDIYYSYLQAHENGVIGFPYWWLVALPLLVAYRRRRNH